MSAAGWGELIALIVLLAVTAPLLGRYMAHVYEGAPSRLDRVFGPVERLIYRACRIDPEREQRWNMYALSVLAFSLVGVLLLYVIIRVQSNLVFNPTDMVNVAPALFVQHRGQLRHQHELAELRRREHAEPPHADDGPHGPELRQRRCRNGRDGRPDPRGCPVPDSGPSATSGST